ncbi:MAG: translation elongation factor 4 [Verrucomicrobiota bacterium]
MSEILTRNFSIIAHIDHGKTTLSDRLLQRTGTIEERVIQDQHLDSMELERERGITIKSHPVTMKYDAKNGKSYRLSLIDTPGHVDFAYEVSRSLSACEGAILMIDAAQGVEAQTVANAHLAMKQGLTIIPVINKIDLPNADVDSAKQQLEDILAIPAEEAVCASAKTGIGIEEILEAIVERVPPPMPPEDDKLRLLVFDSVFDAYRGVIAYVRNFTGSIKAGDAITLMQSNRKYEVKEVGIFTPSMLKTQEIGVGDTGYIIANIKSTADLKIGETITSTITPADEPLPGFKEVQPMVYSGIYPLNNADFESLRTALSKLQLNDPALVYQQESSVALGFGFRCGFLGLLHMEIVQERLRREYNMDLISSYPSVVYHVYKTNGEMLEIDNPTHLPDMSIVDRIEEPTVKGFLLCQTETIGDVLKLVRDRRGECVHTESLDSHRVMLTIEIPLNEILVDFVDKIKTITRGYGSMDYEYGPYREDKLAKMDILINGEPMDAFSTIVHREKAEFRGRQLTAKLKEVIPPQLFKVALQAAIGGKIIAREDVKTVGKNVTAKCYGGDVSRKRKLLEKQKEGKKRMKQFGKVNIPQEAFMQVLKSS